MPSWKDMCEAARATKSWNKTRLQSLFDRRKEVADVMGCNVLMDFVFYFLSFSLASKVFFFPADVTFLIHFCLLFLCLVLEVQSSTSFSDAVMNHSILCECK